MGSFIDLSGQRFGRLTIESREPTLKQGVTRWLCKCDCGKYTVTTTAALRSGNCKSCGCLHVESARAQGLASASHNGTGTRLYRVWSNMKTRCCNPRNANYARWGARGIKICAEWLNDFASFRDWALASGYADDLCLDRIDNDGDYSPGNCRWATPLVQANNTRQTRFITFRGETHSLHEWSRVLGIKVETLFYRLKRLSVEEAFTLPLQNPVKNLKYVV